MKSVIVYQAYGHLYNLEQNLFSILSLLKRHEGLPFVERILVYTDRPEFFRKYLGDLKGMQYESLGPDQLKQWRGAIDFVHRVKIEMLKHSAGNFPQNNVFYVDGDTFFEKDPSHLLALIDPHHSVMHEAETVLELGKDPLSKKINRFIKKAEFKVGGKSIKIPTGTMMWNAGTLGFAPVFFKELDAVIEITDQAYSRYQKHIMEQLAFSYVLATKSRIHSAQEYINHYWRNKEAYTFVISQFLEKHNHLEAGLKEFEFIEWPERYKPKKSFLQKTIGKLLPKNRN